LEGYTDADWGSQQDRHSILGYVFRFHGKAVSWSSKWQSLIALSSTEAEYITATHVTKEAIWLRQLLSDITSPLATPTPIFCDNNGAIALAKNAVYHPRTKHIDIQYHFIHEKMQTHEITNIRVDTTENIADIFTKPLPRPKFESLASKLGLGNMD
jgi:hypothetical protein